METDPVAEAAENASGAAPVDVDADIGTAEPVPAPGEVLRRAREARGQSLRDVVQALKLSSQQLEALENGRFDALPGQTFVRGFLRNYARYLGVDPEPLLASIDGGAPRAEDLTPVFKADGNMPATAAAIGSPRASRVLLLLMVVAALGVGAYLMWPEFRFGFDFPAAGGAREASARPEPPAPVRAAPARPAPARTAPAKAPPPVEAAPVEAAAAGAAAAGAEEPAPIATRLEVQVLPPPVVTLTPVPGETDPATGEAAPAVPVVSTLRFFFDANNVWVEVREGSGKIIFTRMGRKGSSHSVRGKPPFSLIIKQADNVRLEFNGQPVDLESHINKDGIARLALQ